MASNREERFLMRQRGAGARQLRTSGFDLAIPGLSNPPLKPVRSGRANRTPQSGSQLPSSSRRTPKVTPLIPQRSSTRTPATGNAKSSSGRSAAKSQGDGRHEVTTAGGGSSTRRRKLATLLEDARPTTGEVGRQTSPPSQAVDSAPRTELSPERATVIAAGDNNGPEDVIHSTERTSKKRKKRKSIGQNSRKRARTSLPVTNATGIFVSPSSVPSVNNQPENEASKPSAEPDLSMEHPVAQPASESTIKLKRRKRKSIGKLPKVKRKSLTVASPSAQNVQTTTTTTEGEASMQQENTSSTPRRKPRKVLGPVAEVSEDDFDEELSSATKSGHQMQPLDDSVLSSAQTSRPGRPRTSDVSVTAPASKRGPKPLTVRPKPLKRKTQRRISSPLSDPPDRRPHKENPSTIPITVHRLSRPQHLDHSSADEDILACLNPFPKRSGVNAVDVLSQICREIVAKSAENISLGEAKERGQRKQVETRKRKRKAVEMFGEELDARLFQMTEALDNNYALSIRLRQAKKEKVARREELLEIKRLREEVAIEIDEVRAKHEHDSKVAQDELDLHTMISDIELAVQRGRALRDGHGAEDTGGGDELQVRLRTAAETVSSAGLGGGLLEQVRSFNRMVERAIAVL